MPNTQVDQAQRQKIYDEQINILKNLNILQRNEQSLYVQVSEASSQAKKQELMILINELSNQRIQLYNQLLYYTNIIRGNVQQNRANLDNASYNVNLVEDNMNKTKEVLDKNNSNQANKYRLVQINTYYGKKYAANSEIVKTVIIFMVPLLGLAILTNKSILNKEITNYLYAVIIVIGFIVVGKQVYDILSRNNMNFDEYDWNFNPSSQPVRYANVTATDTNN